MSINKKFAYRRRLRPEIRRLRSRHPAAGDYAVAKPGFTGCLSCKLRLSTFDISRQKVEGEITDSRLLFNSPSDFWN
jgi:hypothetical protein